MRLVSPEPIARQRSVDDDDAFGDQRPIPRRAVLVGERDERAVNTEAGASACVVQQHEGEESVDFGIVDQRRELTRQADCLTCQVDVAGVSLVEDEVEGVHHR